MYTEKEVLEIAAMWACYCRDTPFLEALSLEDWFEINKPKSTDVETVSPTY